MFRSKLWECPILSMCAIKRSGWHIDVVIDLAKYGLAAATWKITDHRCHYPISIAFLAFRMDIITIKITYKHLTVFIFKRLLSFEALLGKLHIRSLIMHTEET